VTADSRPGAAAPPARGADPVTAAAALDAEIRSRSAAIERDRRLPADLVAELARAGLFRLGVPASLGGLEGDVATTFRAIEAVSIADGSTGWCVMIGATSGLLAGYLRSDVAREIYGPEGAVVTGGVFAPRGKATVDGGSFVAGGRWPFASGCQHCDWLMGGCVVVENGRMRRLESGAPDSRMLLFPRTEATIHDTWDVAGLRGTGSHDMEISDLRVPIERSVSLIRDRPAEPGALYEFPVFGLLAIGIAAVATGIARRAIDELSALATAKTPTGSSRRLAERSAVRAEVARAEAELRAARAFVFEAIERGTQEAEHGRISVAARTSLRLAATHATASAARAVDRMYEAGGGSSIYAGSALQRCFRDVHVATQHAMVASSTWELAGRIALGLDTDTSML
jgi:alkylation response protein AidB-like acyl-CoA dehydrogenase